MTVNKDLASLTAHSTGFALNASQWNAKLTGLNTIFQDESKDVSFRQFVRTYTAGEALSAGDHVRISAADTVSKVTNASESGIKGYVGVVLEDAALSASVSVGRGKIFGLSGLTAGTTYYIGTNGGITSTKPSSNVKPIGIASTATELEIVGSAHDNEIGAVNIYATQNISCVEGFLQTSDVRAKKGVIKCPLGLEFILGANPAFYQYNSQQEDDFRHHAGLIAQDELKRLTELGWGPEQCAFICEQSGRYSINYSEYVPILINAIKELHDRRIENKIKKFLRKLRGWLIKKI